MFVHNGLIVKYTKVYIQL